MSYCIIRNDKIRKIDYTENLYNKIMEKVEGDFKFYPEITIGFEMTINKNYRIKYGKKLKIVVKKDDIIKYWDNTEIKEYIKAVREPVYNNEFYIIDNIRIEKDTLKPLE